MTKLLTVAELGALVPGIDKMTVDEARAACKAHDRSLHNQLLQSWNEHYGRTLLKHAHRDAKARRHLKKTKAGPAAPPVRSKRGE